MFAVISTTSLLLFFLPVSFAIAPPHETNIGWESVRNMRSRSNITFNFRPKHISEEYCRYISEDLCRAKDNDVALAKSNMKISYQSFQDNGYDGIRRRTEQRVRRLNPSIGTGIRVLVLLVRFPEHDVSTLPTRKYFDDLFNGQGTSKTNPVGSVKEWLRYSSLGQYRVDFNVQDWEVADGSQAFYAREVSGLYGDGIYQMFGPLLTKIDEEGSIDWFDGYIDNFGYLYHLVAIHSGIAAEFGDRICIEDEAKDRIWSIGTPSCLGCWESQNSIELNGFAIASAFGVPNCISETEINILDAPMSVITHEMMHGFGLIDLYDQDSDAPQIGIAGVGRFDLMCNAYGWNQDGAYPAHLSAYSRIQALWLTPIEIVRDGFYAIMPSEISGHVYRISAGYPAGEYLLIENRQPIKWDGDWPTGGVVITHVDEDAPFQTQRGYPGSGTWPDEHYQVAVLQADGRYDIEQGANTGDDEDFWTRGMTLGPNGGRRGGVWPNTDSYQGGQRFETGISITVTTRSRFIMGFQVQGIEDAQTRSSEKRLNKRNVIFDPHQDNTAENGTATVTETIAWTVSMLAAAGLMVGFVMVFL